MTTESVARFIHRVTTIHAAYGTPVVRELAEICLLKVGLCHQHTLKSAVARPVIWFELARWPLSLTNHSVALNSINSRQ